MSENKGGGGGGSGIKGNFNSVKDIFITSIADSK